MNETFLHLWRLLVIFVATCFGFAMPLSANTITVTSLADNSDTDGQVTLREAIEAAENDRSVDGSVAGSGADTIVFDPALVSSGDAVINLSVYDPGNGALAFGPTAFFVHSEIVLIGPSGENGIHIRRADPDIFRLFSVHPGGHLSLKNLTVSRFFAQGGHSRRGGAGAGLGGVIFAHKGEVEVENCTFLDNVAFGGYPNAGVDAFTHGGGMAENGFPNRGGIPPKGERYGLIRVGGEIGDVEPGNIYLGRANEGGGGFFVPLTVKVVDHQGRVRRDTNLTDAGMSIQFQNDLRNLNPSERFPDDVLAYTAAKLEIMRQLNYSDPPRFITLGGGRTGDRGGAGGEGFSFAGGDASSSEAINAGGAGGEGKGNQSASHPGIRTGGQGAGNAGGGGGGAFFERSVPHQNEHIEPLWVGGGGGGGFGGGGANGYYSEWSGIGSGGGGGGFGGGGGYPGGHGGFGGGGAHSGLSGNTSGTVPGGFGGAPAQRAYNSGGGGGMGGVIFANFSTVSIIQCTFSHNDARGGGKFSQAQGFGLGGGLFSRNSRVTILNSTFNGGIGGAVHLLSDGMSQPPACTISNSILYGSQNDRNQFHHLHREPDFKRSEHQSGSPVQVLGGHNLIGNAENAPDGFVVTDQSPELISLRDHGGPTHVFAYDASSPARNTGNNEAASGRLTTDQRGAGYERIGEGTVDIGAFEYSRLSPTLEIVNCDKIFIVGPTALEIAGDLTIEPTEDDLIVSATVRITDGFETGADVLTAAVFPPGVTLHPFDAATGTLRFTGPSTSALYQSALEGVTFFNFSDEPNPGWRTIEIKVEDEDGTSALTCQILVNRLPEIEGFETAATHLENIVNESPQLLDNDVTLIESDSDFNGGNLRVSYASGGGLEDRLSVLGQGDITVSGNVISYQGQEFAGISITDDGKIGRELQVDFVTEHSTPEAVEALLEHLTYQNLSNSPTPQRTVEILLTDTWGGESMAVSQEITVTPEADTTTDFIVTTLEDEDNGLGAGSGNSLREILAFIYQNPGEPATVRFAPALTIAGPASSELTMTAATSSTAGPTAMLVRSEVTIEGPDGANGITLTRATSAPRFRLFHFLPNADVTIRNLNLANGWIEGIEGVADRAGMGGAVYNEGLAVFENCAIYGNRAVGGDSGNGRGGAFHNDAGELILTNTTVANNYASGGLNGGSSHGGGLFNRNGIVRLRHCTFGSNKLGERDPRGASLYNLGDGAGKTATLHAYNNIFASASTERDLHKSVLNDGQTESFSGVNFIQSWDGNSALPLDQNIRSLDPMLEVLAANGGPTLTMALRKGSPLIDVGDNASVTTTADQRLAGFDRIVDNGRGKVDLGAYEAPRFPSREFLVTTLADGGPGSLRAAIAEADLTLVADRIVFDPVLTQSGDGVISLTTFDSGRDLNLNNPAYRSEFGATAFILRTPIEITGPTGDHGIIVERENSADPFRLFHVMPGGDLSLDNLTLRGGLALGGDGSFGGGGAAGLGGAFFNQGNLKLRGVLLDANTSQGGRGSFLSGSGGHGGSVTGEIQPVSALPTFGRGGWRNTSNSGRFGGGGAGGGLYGSPGGFGGGSGAGGFSGSSAGFGAGLAWISSAFAHSGGGLGAGGALFNEGGEADLANVTLANNRALGGDGFEAVSLTNGRGLGGAVFNRGGIVNLLNLTFVGNRVEGREPDGGAVFNLGDGLRTTHHTVLGALGNERPAEVFMSNSILADSIGGTHDFVSTTYADGSATAHGTHNLIETHSGFDGTETLITDPQLLPLTDNGGPTWSAYPAAASPVIDAGDDATATSLINDGRGLGFPREFGAGVDLGAIETQSMTYALWLQQHFTPAQIADPAISGPTADPEDDGNPNLHEYAFWLDPWESDQISDQWFKIDPSTMTIKYAANTSRADLTYTLETCTDLSDWEAVTMPTQETLGVLRLMETNLPDLDNFFARLAISQN